MDEIRTFDKRNDRHQKWPVSRHRDKKQESTDGPTKGWTEGRIDGQTDGRADWNLSNKDLSVESQRDFLLYSYSVLCILFHSFFYILIRIS